MEKSIECAVQRYNIMRIFLNIPIDNLYMKVKHETVPFKITYMSKKKRQEIV